MFREIQQTATSKISIFQNLFVEQYTIHIAHPLFKYSGIYPTYFLHYEQDNGRRIFLLAGRKRKKCSTSTYVLSTDPTDLSRQGKSTLATLRYFREILVALIQSDFETFQNIALCNCKSFVTCFPRGEHQTVLRQRINCKNILKYKYFLNS